MEDADPNTP
jgi:Ca2+-dependent lipid-binding protein